MIKTVWFDHSDEDEDVRAWDQPSDGSIVVELLSRLLRADGCAPVSVPPSQKLRRLSQQRPTAQQTLFSSAFFWYGEMGSMCRLRANDQAHSPITSSAQ